MHPRRTLAKVSSLAPRLKTCRPVPRIFASFRGSACGAATIARERGQQIGKAIPLDLNMPAHGLIGG